MSTLVGVDNPYVHVLSRLAHRALAGIPACHRSCAVGARAVEIPTCRLRTPQLAAYLLYSVVCLHILYVPTPYLEAGTTWPEPGKCVNLFDCLWTQRYAIFMPPCDKLFSLSTGPGVGLCDICMYICTSTTTYLGRYICTRRSTINLALVVMLQVNNNIQDATNPVDTSSVQLIVDPAARHATPSNNLPALVGLSGAAASPSSWAADSTRC